MAENLKAKNWHNLDIKEVFKFLKTSKDGLTDKIVESKQKKFGKNKLPSERKLSKLRIFFNQIKSPLVYVLIIAAGISILLNHFTDAAVIILAVMVNSFFGFWQENKANNAITQLKKIVRQETKVLRNGHKVQIDSVELVPGDIIFVEAGDKVPADARLIETKNLEIIESNLTGESNNSKKNTKKILIGTALADRENMIYMSTLVAQGQGLAVVTATGIKTEIGKITNLIKETKDEATPLQERLTHLSKVLTFVIGITCLLIFILGITTGKDPVDIFITVVALAVAAIPEGLVVAVTIILTLGMQFILKKKALVRRLVSAETLGSTSIICTDKTGTLTEGKMRVSKIITAEKEYTIDEKTELSEMEKVQDLISKISILCSSASIENPDAELEHMKIIGDSTEKALLLAAIQSGFDKDKLDDEYRELDQIPFDSSKKFMATIHEHKDKSHRHVFVKGAPEKIFDFCSKVLEQGKKKKLTAKQLSYLKNKYQKLTKKGLRVLAFAYKTGKNFEQTEEELKDLVFLGFIALKDPLRKEAKAAIELAEQAGIRPIVITGDHRLTAQAIFEEIYPKRKFNIVEGDELDRWTDEELKEKVVDIDIYARVEPKHKLRVVDAWQARGEVVAMTGDGVNDAPALKSADIGVAMADGSDVTKETADLILLDNNFKVIVAAVEQGRVIFDNIRKVIVYLLADSFSEMALIAFSLVMGLPVPILATQIIWINLINDGLPNVAMSLEPGEEGIMKNPPRSRKEPLLNSEMKIIIFAIGLITDILLILLFYFMLGQNYDIAYIRTVMFAIIGTDSLIYAFSIRKLHHSIFSSNPFQNKYLILAVSVSFILLLAAIYLPFLQTFFHTVNIGLMDWLVVFGISIFNVVMFEIVKYYFIIKEKKIQKQNILNHAR